MSVLSQSYDVHLNLILADVEETLATIEEGTNKISVSHKP